MTHVDAILARLLALHFKRIDLSLDRMWRILDALGHPERRLPPVIHVAGTNGKGSTVAFMRAMLEAAGQSVHAYTSPNLVRINERFRLGRPGGGVPIVISRQTEGPLAVIMAHAAEVRAPLHVAGQDWVAGEERGRLVYQDSDGLLDLPGPRLFGRHQFDNAGTAIAALRAAQLKLPSQAFEQGVVAADWA